MRLEIMIIVSTYVSLFFYDHWCVGYFYDYYEIKEQEEQINMYEIKK